MKTLDLSPIKSLFESELLLEIEKVGVYKKIPQGELMIDLDEKVQFIPLILEGAVKVVREDESGDELLLYFVEFGNTCAMTLNCCLGHSKSEIRALCESDVSLILIPVQYMDPWLSQFKSWRSFVFNSFNTRLSELLKAIDALTFLKLDERLENYLLEKSKVLKNKTLHITHFEIAADLNSSRVVISRLLKQLENEGFVTLGRNSIRLLDQT
ncbi:Crp/Fnr family transcriptional regulator [Flavobacteriaceae bacterium]|nr:Crp/Fnr family transcriptional regulator [Flavobacteriaceae bacterium]